MAAGVPWQGYYTAGHSRLRRKGQQRETSSLFAGTHMHPLTTWCTVNGPGPCPPHAPDSSTHAPMILELISIFFVGAVSFAHFQKGPLGRCRGGSWNPHFPIPTHEMRQPVLYQYCILNLKSYGFPPEKPLAPMASLLRTLPLTVRHFFPKWDPGSHGHALLLQKKFCPQIQEESACHPFLINPLTRILTISDQKSNFLTFHLKYL